MAATKPLEPNLEFIRRLKAAGGEDVKKCYQCATCSVACPLSPEDHPFPRKEMIWAQWGLEDRIIPNPDIWLCYQCNDCSKLCPRGAHPGDVLAAARKLAFEHYAVPQLLGRALGNAKALPLLLAVPIVLFIGVIYYGPQFNAAFPEVMQHGSWYGRFFPLLAIDTIFIVTTLLMALALLAGLARFWKDMMAARPGKPKLDFIPAFIEMVKEVLLHKRFTECDTAQPRKAPHLLTFWGMLLLFVTTACVFLGLYFVGLHIPMGIENPIKWLGIAGAAAFVVGVFQLWSMRRNDPDAAGKSAYQDWLFLWILMIIAVTGILAYLLRLWSVEPTAMGMPVPGEELPFNTLMSGTDTLAIAAVGIYFIHLVTVWFLIAYLPYSKFAHMVYRATALVYAFRIGRIEPVEEEGEPHGHDDEDDAEEEEEEGEAHEYEGDEEDEEEKEGDDHKAA